MTCKYYSDDEENFYGSNCDFAVTNSVTYEIETDDQQNSSDVLHYQFYDGCGTGSDACFNPESIVYSKTMYGPEDFTLKCDADDQGKVLCYTEQLGYVEGDWSEMLDEETGEGFVAVSVQHFIENEVDYMRVYMDCKFTSEEHSECTWGR